MENQLFKNEKLNNYVSLLKNFFYTRYYPMLLIAISFVFWISDQSVAGICILLIVGLISFIINEDVSPLSVMIPIMVMTVYHDNFLQFPSHIALICVVGILFLFAAIFNFVHYKHKLRMGKLTVPLICISIALLFGSIGSPYTKDYLRGFAYVFYLGILMLALYTYIISCSRIPDTVDKKLYFARLVFILTILCLLQVITIHIDIFIDVGTDLSKHFRNQMYVGWSNRSGLGIIMVLTLSLAFYFAEISKKHNFLLYNFGIIIYAAILSTGSRGAMLFGTIEMIAIAIYLLIKSNHKKSFILTLVIWAVLAIVFIAVKWDMFAELLEKFKELGLAGHGRSELYHEAIELYLKYPLFGVGCGYIGPPENYTVYPGCTYWFHSTPLHIMAVTGTFGIFCYGYFYINKFKIIFNNKSLFNVLVGIGLISFELQALIDASTFQPFPFLYAAILLTTALEMTNMDTKKEKI